jgi:hypothetical protein
MSIIVVSYDPESLTAAAPPKGKYGRSGSLKWPWLFDQLRAKGMSKEKAAAIANANLKYRKKGRLNVLTAKQADKPSTLARIRKAQKTGKHMTAKSLTKG